MAKETSGWGLPSIFAAVAVVCFAVYFTVVQDPYNTTTGVGLSEHTWHVIVVCWGPVIGIHLTLVLSALVGKKTAWKRITTFWKFIVALAGPIAGGGLLLSAGQVFGARLWVKEDQITWWAGGVLVLWSLTTGVALHRCLTSLLDERGADTKPPDKEVSGASTTPPA